MATLDPSTTTITTLDPITSSLRRITTSDRPIISFHRRTTTLARLVHHSLALLPRSRSRLLSVAPVANWLSSLAPHRRPRSLRRRSRLTITGHSRLTVTNHNRSTSSSHNPLTRPTNSPNAAMAKRHVWDRALPFACTDNGKLSNAHTAPNAMLSRTVVKPRHLRARRRSTLENGCKWPSRLKGMHRSPLTLSVIYVYIGLCEFSFFVV